MHALSTRRSIARSLLFALAGVVCILFAASVAAVG
jgi:hypothetical protein